MAYLSTIFCTILSLYDGLNQKHVAFMCSRKLDQNYNRLAARSPVGQVFGKDTGSVNMERIASGFIRTYGIALWPSLSSICRSPKSPGVFTKSTTCKQHVFPTFFESSRLLGHGSFDIPDVSISCLTELHVHILVSKSRLPSYTDPFLESKIAKDNSISCVVVRKRQITGTCVFPSSKTVRTFM
jgi:hypothetical protein